MCNSTKQLETQTGKLDFACVRCNKFFTHDIWDESAELQFPRRLYSNTKTVHVCPECYAPHCNYCAKQMKNKGCKG